ncbi:hypothetical protein HK105_200856 [Polyrhizophydium stewartii]|uniref:Peptidase S54 rhomboid domain-containing protein n=1 Tax=Polyrhizophydium stewartii TaxID=2732419 RepID=A0ABR4NI52_9FUNG
MVLDGTQLFVVGTAALTLPSLLTTYWKELFITRPPLSSAYVREHGFVSFQVEPRFKLLTPKHTFVTHMFRHSDLLHWFTNMYSMATSAAFLDLGFWRSSLLFYGGGIAGAASQILERTMLRDSRSRLTIEPAREWLREAGDQLSNWIAGKPTEDAKIIGLFSGLFPTTFSMCGASGGVFALIGAETYLISVALWRILTGRERSRRHLREQRLADLIAMIASRASAWDCSSQGRSMRRDRQQQCPSGPTRPPSTSDTALTLADSSLACSPCGS